jgi:hypothetical protein
MKKYPTLPKPTPKGSGGKDSKVIKAHKDLMRTHDHDKR